jgi:hypothetical protein
MDSAGRVSILILFSFLFLCSGGAAVQCQTFSVSVLALQMTGNERIVGFEIHVHSGRVAQLPNVPIGWNISVDNDPSWETSVTGSISVGSAAVNANFLRGFMVVEAQKDAPSDLPFDLKGEVILTSDFVKERRIKLTMKDFQIKRVRRP